MSETKTSKEYEDEVFITELAIRQVRHLKDIHIPLSKDDRKHLILTGKNGSGKTSVLTTLANLFHDPEGYKEWMSFETNIGEKNLTRHNWLKGFILAFYSAKRKIELEKPDSLNKIAFKDRYEVNEDPGKIFLQYIVNLKAEKSFARDDNDLETAKNIEQWFEMFENALKELFEDPGLKLEFDRQLFNFRIIEKGKVPFDFNTLADGYSAIIKIVTDLIIRMENRKTKSYDVQGIVLIDEIDAHLHIDLQKKIFPFLIRFFPRIQFIVTTHSPFVLNSIENAVIYDLEKKLLVNDLSGYAYDGIVEGYFENDKYSEIIKKKIERYEQLANRKKRTETEEDQMKELKKYLECIPSFLAPELKVKLHQIELNRIGKQDD